MNRRVALAIGLVGINLMACCCGGPLPFNKNQAQQPVLVGPQKSTFNQQLVEKYDLKEEDFRALQYYLASELVLTREVNREELARGAKKGKLVQSKGLTIEEVVISPKTPGVCTLIEKDRLGARVLNLSFEEGTSFKFGRRGDQDYIAITEGDGDEIKIVFAGNTYKASRAAVAAAFVIVGEESLDNFQKNRKELKGVKLPQ